MDVPLFLFGESPEETFQWKSKRSKRKRMSKWEDTDTEYLRGILDDHPEYYLDEIQTQLSFLNGKWFSGKTIYRHMRQLGYSLKVAYEKSVLAANIYCNYLNHRTIVSTEPADE